MKAADFFSHDLQVQKNFIIISDLQKRTSHDLPEIEGVNSYVVKLEPENVNNISIDTALATSKLPDEIGLQVKLSFSGSKPEEVPVAVFDGHNLLAKKTVKFDTDSTGSTVFNFPAAPIPNGRIEIDDNGLSFDNQMFFSVNRSQPVKLVAIGEQDMDFLKRIYKAPEFDASFFSVSNVDYNALSQANLIILNEPEKIPSSLVNTLQKLHSEDVFILIIPSEKVDLQEQNLLLRALNLPLFKEKKQQEKLITKIAFSNPLYEEVFDEQVQNFQYPKVNSYFSLNFSGNPVLSFENNEPFLLEKDHVFLFSAALNDQNSNFKNSPLIVPSLYNMGKLTISSSRLYFGIGKPEEVNLDLSLQKDEILKLSSSEAGFIPRQQSFQNKVKLFFDDLPSTAGHYRILRDTIALETLAFNYDRRESRLSYLEPQNLKDFKVLDSVPKVFDEIQSAGEVDLLWKWFAIFALVFLLTEMLILKFFK